MIDEDTYCIDIPTQISAITSALNAVAVGLVDAAAASGAGWRRLPAASCAQAGAGARAGDAATGGSPGSASAHRQCGASAIRTRHRRQRAAFAQPGWD